MSQTGKPENMMFQPQISVERICELTETFRANKKLRLAQNAVTQTTADDVALNREIVTASDFTFSITLDDWQVTNQQKSGRCWMFAALNLLRVGTMDTLNVRDFEFSQNYTLFWDKFERSNYFFEEILSTSHLDVDDRLIAHMLNEPLSDGGQWNMAVNIIRKHGLVPKQVMPESESSSNTRRMNAILKYKLREGARDLRAAVHDGVALDQLREKKHKCLDEIWRILCIHLGTPPSQFDWQWTDKDGDFHRDALMSPQEFAARYVDIPIDDYVCLVHDPRPENEYGQTYTVQFLGNVIGGDPVVYLNVEMDLIKKTTQRLLEEGIPVWFGCDVGQHMRRDLGLWDTHLFDYENLYDVSFGLDKAARLHHHETLMTHAMLFTGVDVRDGCPRRWKVENSWGAEIGRDGFYQMNDSWFDEYVFEIAAPKSILPDDLIDALERTPKVLPAWDPMGALAR
ncbi:MAG: C1 family peptidase [Myxococcota bacterium]|nr:C1 family peptidase [Myxococcota bacterium]